MNKNRHLLCFCAVKRKSSVLLLRTQLSTALSLPFPFVSSPDRGCATALLKDKNCLLLFLFVFLFSYTASDPGSYPPVYFFFFPSSFTTGVWIVSSHFVLLSLCINTHTYTHAVGQDLCRHTCTRCCTYVSVSGCGTILSSAGLRMWLPCWGTGEQAADK